MKRFGIILAFFYAHTINAQNEIDALRYSQHNIFSTAKFCGIGGSFGSLGGDFGSLSLNPAGLALYQNSELTFTPNFGNIETTSYLNGNKSTNYTSSATFANLGYITSSKNNHDKWKRINFGFGWNQTANFHNSFLVQSENNQSSLADLLLNQADGNTIDNLHSFGAELAFWTDLIDLENNLVDTVVTNWYAFDNGNYISHINSNSNKRQSQLVNSNGEMGEFVFSIGSSFEERIYLGATIGVPTIEYREKSSYSEHLIEDTVSSIKSFNYNEELVASGSGVNIKIGGIIRLLDNMKIGGAIHSPNYISMQEEYMTSISTFWTDREILTETSPLGYFSYEITTPWKLIGSFSTIINKNSKFLPIILINADIEHIDYSSTRMYADYYQFTEENNLIKELYTTATNIRIGGEAILDPLKIRGGYSVYGSPFKNNPEYEIKNYSVGLGIDLQSMFFDISYSLNQRKTEHSMYNANYERSAILNTQTSNILCTVGFRF